MFVGKCVSAGCEGENLCALQIYILVFGLCDNADDSYRKIAFATGGQVFSFNNLGTTEEVKSTLSKLINGIYALLVAENTRVLLDTRDYNAGNEKKQTIMVVPVDEELTEMYISAVGCSVAVSVRDERGRLNEFRMNDVRLGTTAIVVAIDLADRDRIRS